MIWYILLSLHCTVCVSIIIMQKRNMVETTDLIMPIIIFVPIWGLLAFVFQEIVFDEKKQAVEKLSIYKQKKLDLKYRQIETEKKDANKTAVPLEEAIQINDAKTRRSLMLEVLHSNPSEYLWMLQRASVSHDVELTHYATTTIMEVQSDFENMLHKYSEKIVQAPDDRELLSAYAKDLAKYIDSGLLTGNVLMIHRKQLDNLLQKLLYGSKKEKWIYYLSIENCLEMNQYKKTGELLREAKYRWPYDEKLYMLFVSYYWHLGMGQEIQELLNDIKDNNRYLSQEGKEWFQFWYKGDKI